jgi:hypothetical protein
MRVRVYENGSIAQVLYINSHLAVLGHEHPTWSPSGSRLAWGGRGGIWATSIAGGNGDCGADPRLLIRGGSEPDWGRAEMPRRR